MIKSLAYKTGSFLVAVLMIAATGGIPLYQHLCHCGGESSASIFLETSCEHEVSNQPSTCCEMEKSQTCCADNPVKDTGPACHDGDCCQTSSQFIKINDSFLAGIEKLSPNPHLIAIIFETLLSPVDITSGTSFDLDNIDLPPPSPGKKIVIAIHQLKLDPSLS